MEKISDPQHFLSKKIERIEQKAILSQQSNGTLNIGYHLERPNVLDAR